VSRYGSIAFTPAVQAVQEQLGSRRAYARSGSSGETPDALDGEARDFLAERDSFYMASVSETGWPYVQYRGGPKGFVRVLDEHNLGFADYRGNRQYVSVGNLSKDDRVALIFVDYPHRTRLKIFAHASVATAADSAHTLAKLVVPGYRAHIERGILLSVEGFDWNCPQHIIPRFTEEQIHARMAPLVATIKTLEKENAELRRLQGGEPRGAT
jgi:predicted pyridoxine 5'-phosphate oxidase superfamily flavin-nucleotide-binding protein